ncbi:hypothetical protein QQ056_17100 [Oscillatoria laete-virens NRMC-F 0139]|nr:hypothetical protein [Oscillatoria laete-virens]MDL5055251.1 hypothetical protein [Oscillatoria laete-virens NRMC-F 0139]
MSDVEITVGANNQGLSSGLASAQSQLNSFGKSFDSAFGLDSENKIKRNLGGLVTDLSRANSLMDVLAISANRLENVFKSMASIGISFAVGLAMKSALEGAAKEADNLLGAMQKTASFSASGKTVADLERQKELVAAQADRLKEAGLLTRLLYSDGLAAAAKLAETEQKLLDIAIEKRKQAELTAALSAQDKRMGDRFEAKAFKALTKYETDDSKLFKMVSDANAKIAAAENEFNASSDVERRAELIKEIEKAEAQILAIQGRRNELQREVDQAAKSAADQAAAKEREIVAEEKRKKI